ncbi:MAG: AAA family ATPase [Acidimicrobiales bacterium]
MLLTRLYLRNFRVFEDELDLPLPPGLVGVYGPNGAGKSTLLEAILFTLWGKARTTKEHVRSAGVGAECRAEVEFEHEGHLYLVRRSLKGINSTVQVEAHCDGALMSTGTKDAERYVESILGLDDSAFRASVLAEQKQLAAFSNQSPADRRKLVLHLLGITPLDTARDLARKDARQAVTDHEHARGMLADVDTLATEAGDAEARAGAAEATAATEAGVAAAAEERAKAAEADVMALDLRRQEHHQLVVEGRGARQELDSASQSVADLRAELDALAAAAEQFAGHEAAARGLDRAEAELAAVGTAAAAARSLATIVVPEEPPVVDAGGIGTARNTAVEARERLAGIEALARAAGTDLARASEASRRSATLSGEADCPVCGQALGAAFEQVQAHRAQEVDQAEQRVADLARRAVGARSEADDAAARLQALESAAQLAASARSRWEEAARRRQDAQAALAEAWVGVLAVAPGTPTEAPGADELAGEVAALRDLVGAKRAAAGEAERLRGRLERRPQLESSLAAATAKAEDAQRRVQDLRAKVAAVGFDQTSLEQAALAHRQAAEAGRLAAGAARQAEVAAARDRERADAAARRLADAREQHGKLARLESDARHLARVAGLLGEFRNTVVASVGPRLAVQAGELFGELTDHEYDELQVDPESYQLQIRDGGFVYGLERFSGSEIDLANLALRVAISEHIHFQSGGSVGLLVLDEVFGPLDEDRKARMLLALERLRTRFRQVLVVTHDSEIKEQLPNAIEVVKLPGRRATARVLAG